MVTIQSTGKVCHCETSRRLAVAIRALQKMLRFCETSGRFVLR